MRHLRSNGIVRPREEKEIELRRDRLCECRNPMSAAGPGSRQAERTTLVWTGEPQGPIPVRGAERTRTGLAMRRDAASFIDNFPDHYDRGLGPLIFGDAPAKRKLGSRASAVEGPSASAVRVSSRLSHWLK
jgi:hypothetical protein